MTTSMRAPARGRWGVLFLLLLLSLFILPVHGADSIFTDVSQDAWYYDAVKAAYQQGLMEGVGDGCFAPEEALTQSMLVTVLNRMTGLMTDDEGVGDWATEVAETTGLDQRLLSQNTAVTREMLALFLVRYAEAADITLPTLVVGTYADGSTASGWAKEAVDTIRVSGLMSANSQGRFRPKDKVTRAEAATVFVRLNSLISGGHPAVLRLWQTDSAIQELENPILSSGALAAAAETYGIDRDSDAYQALKSINLRYAQEITDRDVPLLFFFEGVGTSDDPELRLNAMAVLVQNGEITFLSQNCSTIPDYPFLPKLNSGMAVPTIVSGIYDFDTINHRSRYGALRILGDSVVRFSSQTSYYLSTSGGIHIHRRYLDEPVPLSEGWANSTGCLLLGSAGITAQDEYATFTSTLGIVASGSLGTAKYQTAVTGKVIIDRTYARDYLLAVGYPAEAIDLLG